MAAIIGLKYTEPYPDTYKGATLTINGEGILIQSELTPSDDIQTCTAIALNLGYGVVYYSSSVDNFVMDGGNLEACYTTKPDKGVR